MTKMAIQRKQQLKPQHQKPPSPQPPQPPARPPPPAEWLWPREGDWIQVEVAIKKESPPTWVAAQVVVMLVDGMFQAQIVLPDGTDEWLDWFTWEEEGSDWRRAETNLQFSDFLPAAASIQAASAGHGDGRFHNTVVARRR